MDVPPVLTKSRTALLEQRLRSRSPAKSPSGTWESDSPRPEWRTRSPRKSPTSRPLRSVATQSYFRDLPEERLAGMPDAFWEFSLYVGMLLAVAAMHWWIAL